MATITRTFGTRLLPAYVAGAIIEIAHFRAMTFDSDELAAFYLDSAIAIIDVGSFNIGKIAELDGDETDVEKSLAILKAESLSNKIGLKFLTRKNNTGTWDEIAEFIILNFGRKDYLDLRGRLGFPSRVMERNDAIAVQLVDYGDGLLWDTDFIKIDFGCTIEVEKKNNVEALMARISALELALEGKLTNLPANTLLGRNTNIGTVEVISRATFKSADSDLIDGINSDRIVSGSNLAKASGGLGSTPLSVIATNGSGFFDCWGTQVGDVMPPGINHMHGISVRHSDLSNLWGMQIGGQYNINELYFRGFTANVTSAWRRLWNDANFNPTAHTQTFTAAMPCKTQSTGAIPANYANTVGFQVFASTSADAAYFAFARPGIFGTYLGLDTDNTLKYGGWSEPNKNRVWHEKYGVPVWQAPSDASLKKSIQPIKSALDMINECNPVRFQYNSKIKQSGLYGSKKEREKYHYGFIAQDFPIGDLVYEKENEYLGIDYIEIIPFLVRAIQELNQKIDDI